MERLSLKPGGLGNHLKKMIAKNYLTKSDITRKITLKSYMFPIDNNQGYRVKITKK